MIFKAECVLLFNAGVLFAIIDNEFFLWAEQIRRDSVNFIHSALERLFNISLKSSSFVSIDIELESILLSFRIVICNGKHDYIFISPPVKALQQFIPKILIVI